MKLKAIVLFIYFWVEFAALLLGAFIAKRIGLPSAVGQLVLGLLALFAMMPLLLKALNQPK